MNNIQNSSEGCIREMMRISSHYGKVYEYSEILFFNRLTLVIVQTSRTLSNF